MIPDGLAVEEVMHQQVADMRVVPDMHRRKAEMHELSDAYIALPGGVGTFEELFEVLAWRQLKIHGKPIGVLDVRGFFEPFREAIERSVTEGFMKPKNRQLFVTETDPAVLLDQLRGKGRGRLTPHDRCNRQGNLSSRAFMWRQPRIGGLGLQGGAPQRALPRQTGWRSNNAGAQSETGRTDYDRRPDLVDGRRHTR
ncbi:MAG: hypothetical protein CM1200mP2_25590 [Planctomycetaceae bacterium]|nr:MAG: hypothetical protein CM1200mP2_25590 [Planctomycetaceae bacterium]